MRREDEDGNILLSGLHIARLNDRNKLISWTIYHFQPCIITPIFWQLIFKGSPGLVLDVHSVFINAVLRQYIKMQKFSKVKKHGRRHVTMCEDIFFLISQCRQRKAKAERRPWWGRSRIFHASICPSSCVHFHQRRHTPTRWGWR